MSPAKLGFNQFLRGSTQAPAGARRDRELPAAPVRPSPAHEALEALRPQAPRR